MNSSVSDNGKVVYNTQEGQVRMSGAPNNYAIKAVLNDRRTAEKILITMEDLKNEC